MTIDYGIFEIQDKQYDYYYGIPATIVSKNDNIYHLVLLRQTKTMKEFFQENALFYLLIWITSLLCILLLSRFILKKALTPTENVGVTGFLGHKNMVCKKKGKRTNPTLD